MLVLFFHSLASGLHVLGPVYGARRRYSRLSLSHEFHLAEVVGKFDYGFACRECCRNFKRVDNGAAVIADQIDRRAFRYLEIGIESTLISVSACVEQNRLARTYLGPAVSFRDQAHFQVVPVIGQETAAEIDRPLRLVENLNPSVTSSVVIHDAGAVRLCQNL